MGDRPNDHNLSGPHLKKKRSPLIECLFFYF